MYINYTMYTLHVFDIYRKQGAHPEVGSTVINLGLDGMYGTDIPPALNCVQHFRDYGAKGWA